MQTALKTERLRMSYEEFLKWAGEDTYAEWVDGEVILLMPPKEPHQTIVGLLYFLLQSLASLREQSKVIVAPFEVFLPSRPSSREPDILVITGERLQNLSEERFSGGPDLVVEVVSEDSVRRDRVEKFLEYEREAVREYWLIDSRPRHRGLSVFVLEQGSFVPMEENDEGWFESRVLPGFRVKRAWFSGEQLPDPASALHEMLSPELRQRLAQRILGGSTL
jgi:Uma2 family endonuclease